MATNRQAMEYVYNLLGGLLELEDIHDPENWKNQSILGLIGSQLKIFVLTNSWGEKIINVQLEFREDDINRMEDTTFALS